MIRSSLRMSLPCFVALLLLSACASAPQIRSQGTSKPLTIDYDAKWSNYGQYLQKLVETVQVQWERIIIQSSAHPPSGSTVTVKFRIEATEGGSEIIEAEGTAGSLGVEACKSAITARAPYGKWTDDMIAVLGQSQEMTFKFHYGKEPTKRAAFSSEDRKESK